MFFDSCIGFILSDLRGKTWVLDIDLKVGQCSKGLLVRWHNNAFFFAPPSRRGLVYAASAYFPDLKNLTRYFVTMLVFFPIYRNMYPQVERH